MKVCYAIFLLLTLFIPKLGISGFGNDGVISCAVLSPDYQTGF